MKQSLFMPCVTVNDSGLIEVDWSGSYVNTVDLDHPDQEETYEDTGHAGIIDGILGLGDDTTPADSLRRLADHIEGCADHG